MLDDALSVVVCGASATMDVPTYLTALRKRVPAPLRVLLTASATRFVTPQAIDWLVDETCTSDGPDLNPTEFAMRSRAIVVLPCTANMIAAAALGLAATPAQTALLAAPGPVLFFPNMHERMWSRPTTQRHVATLRGDGHVVVDPHAREAFLLWSGEWAPARVLPPAGDVAKVVQEWWEGGDGRDD